MDNASKAIIMAGSVLVAIGIISLALYFYGMMRGYFAETEQMYSDSYINNFNRFYQSYVKPDGKIYAIDAINIYNKAIDDGFKKSAISMPVDVTTLDPDDYLTEYKDYHLEYDSEGRVKSISWKSL